MACLEATNMRKKNKEVIKDARGAITATKEAIEAQVLLVAPNFDTFAIGAFKKIQDVTYNLNSLVAIRVVGPMCYLINRYFMSLRMMTCDHLLPPDRYHPSVEDHLRVTGFYHASQIGVVQCQKALINALVERWRPETHTFHLPIGECTVTLEDVAVILGLPTNGLPVTGMTLSSFEALEGECFHQFGVAPRKADCRGSGIKLTWLRNLKERIQLTDEISMQRCATDINNFRWRNWERGDNRYRYLSLAHFRKALDEVQEGQFVWVAYGVDRIDPGIIPEDILMHAVVWSATVPLISFESIEWHATDRIRRQFGFVQGVPHQEWNPGRAHGETLAGPKNLDWATAPSHSCWIMHWTNKYNNVLTEYLEPSQHPLDVYMHWYRREYGNHLNLSNVGFMAADAGQSQFGHQPEFMPGRFSLDTRIPCHTASVASGGLVSGDSSRSDGGRGILNSRNLRRVSMGQIEENAGADEHETDEYLMEEPDDEDQDESDDEEMDEDEESRNNAPDDGDDAGETGKHYNLRVDPPRRSANRYTPSLFKKAKKKCKNFVEDIKWAIRK
ncbi:uncharacterized protein LOC110266542 [Arachis ipaensis]|uniref:uncharacterized protein LOC110266542 n=1 Tax=Arachis ipaensis TaxID=130454 RepID=UPI000A2AF0B1|nr:uncharacterized protein LOC110266542 [Arachis ipaensis]